MSALSLLVIEGKPKVVVSPFITSNWRETVTVDCSL